MNSMKGINNYYKELPKEAIEAKAHRDFIGGLWEELGQLQLEFLKKAGLEPDHKLLDIGCGCLRGGIRYVRYLNEGNYYGLDINKSLIYSGQKELEEAGLTNKKANLIVDDIFSINRFNTKFEYMVSVSLFTHLPINIILRCLHNVRESLASNGVYYSTFFQSPSPIHLENIMQEPGGIVTNYDSDPFHYSKDELELMATLANLEVSIIGDWGHPKNQKMAAFRLSK